VDRARAERHEAEQRADERRDPAPASSDVQHQAILVSMARASCCDDAVVRARFSTALRFT
jgi:hypothetical protein